MWGRGGLFVELGFGRGAFQALVGFVYGLHEKARFNPGHDDWAFLTTKST